MTPRGFIVLWDNPVIFLSCLCESARGQGVGTQLLEAVKTEAQRRGCSRLMLVNSRDRDSYKRKFYEMQGWKERVEIANFLYVLK